MTTALLLLLSAAMVAAGVTLIWRDVRRKGRDPFLLRGDVQSLPDADVEVTVSHRPPDPAPARAVAMAVAFGHAPDADQQWAALQPVIAAAVERVNAVLAGAGVAIGAPGEPSRSMSGRGYGVYRRILIGGESLAWLRIELAGDGRLLAGVKAHKEDFAPINASSSVAVQGLDVARASDLLSECLKPAASLAVDAVHTGSAARWAGEAEWKAIDPVVAAALKATNGALAQAGARFVPLGAPAWDDDVRRHRLAVRVEVYHTEVARLHIERVGAEVDVAVGLPDTRLAELGRRQSVPLQGLTTHALAELIASCAWPAIAHYREAQHLA
jgi:hypothetical protein